VSTSSILNIVMWTLLLASATMRLSTTDLEATLGQIVTQSSHSTAGQASVTLPVTSLAARSLYRQPCRRQMRCSQASDLHQCHSEILAPICMQRTRLTSLNQSATFYLIINWFQFHTDGNPSVLFGNGCWRWSKEQRHYKPGKNTHN